MIGLKRGTVKLTEYSAEWPNCYELEKRYILDLVGADIKAIEHIGSTSVPGLKAKPIIDIAIEVVNESNLKRIVEPLVDAGYDYFGERVIKGDYCFMKGPEEKRTHKIHVSFESSDRMQKFIKFRNTLRQNSKLKEEYENLKVELAQKYQSNGRLYTEIKGELVTRIINS